MTQAVDILDRPEESGLVDGRIESGTWPQAAAHDDGRDVAAMSAAAATEGLSLIHI